MSNFDRFRAILEACPIADKAEWLRHAGGFVAAFVVPERRERWADFLARRPDQIRRNSHKLHSALDRRFCHPSPGWPARLAGDGVYYDFRDNPRIVSAVVAEDVAYGEDAIFSLVPGELAVYSFHEGEAWLCQRPPKRA